MTSCRLRLFARAALTIFGLLATTDAFASEIELHGLLDFVVAEHGRASDLNVLTRSDSPFDAYGARVFGEARVNNRLQVFTQVVLRDASSIYVDGAYAMFTLSSSRDVHVLAGKLPWAIGTYGPRTYSNHNPLIGTPLMYQYHTTLLWYEFAPGADALLAARGTGNAGVDYFGYAEGRGMALVDDSYWDVGVTVTGSVRPLEFALGGIAGTPGWASTAQEENSGKTVLGRVGLAPWPGVRMGLSGAYGPYLVDALNSELPAGRSATDYHQELGMADLEVFVGHLEARAEAARNTWQTVAVGDLNVSSGYAEFKYSLSFGGFVAGRWDALRFGKIANSSGEMHPWDANVTRLETGVGYRFDRNAVVKLVHQRTRLETGPEPDRQLSMFAAQLSVTF